MHRRHLPILSCAVGPLPPLLRTHPLPLPPVFSSSAASSLEALQSCTPACGLLTILSGAVCTAVLGREAIAGSLGTVAAAAEAAAREAAIAAGAAAREDKSDIQASAAAKAAMDTLAAAEQLVAVLSPVSIGVVSETHAPQPLLFRLQHRTVLTGNHWRFCERRHTPCDPRANPPPAAPASRRVDRWLSVCVCVGGGAGSAAAAGHPLPATARPRAGLPYWWLR